LFDTARFTANHQPMPVCNDDLRIRRSIDETHLELLIYVSRRIRDELEVRAHPTNPTISDRQTAT